MTPRSSGFWPVLLVGLVGCAGTSVTPGTPRSVARAAAAAYVAAGHSCQVKADVAYCDTEGSSDLPLLIAYDPKKQELYFVTVFDTQTELGRACPAVPAARVLRPDWMIVKCDPIELVDHSKRVVLSVLGGGRMPDLGMSRAEVNRSAGIFLREAESYLARLRATVASPASVRVLTDPRSTTL